jgi:predicted GIY-YIG superfamily endonuclease/uncharacterized Zn-finger protein
MPPYKPTPGKSLGDLFPEVAAEVVDADPFFLRPASSKKVLFQCSIGHQYQCSVGQRTGKTPGHHTGCPYCSGNKILIGFNDLASTHPDVAREAYGVDPTTLSAGSTKRPQWKCSLGHLWSATVNNRTSNNNGCPYCSPTNAKVLAGFNDLATKFPEIAVESYGWDPSTVTGRSSNKKYEWRGPCDHIWSALISDRTNGRGCPYCSTSNTKVLAGFNDLSTLFPDVAEEADGWDTSSVTAYSKKKLPWLCDKGHRWKSSVGNRTANESGCPECFGTGFRTTRPGHLYLMLQPEWGALQIGISNSKTRRTDTHASYGWQLLDMIGPLDGEETLATEQALKRWLRSKYECGLAPGGKKFSGHTESWYEKDLKVTTIKELRQMANV